MGAKVLVCEIMCQVCELCIICLSYLSRFQRLLQNILALVLLVLGAIVRPCSFPVPFHITLFLAVV